MRQECYFVWLPVAESEVVGIYDYISGTVHGLDGCCHDESESQVKVIY